MWRLGLQMILQDVEKRNSIGQKGYEIFGQMALSAGESVYCKQISWQDTLESR